jgi:Domain of unknown function (DUF6916)
MTYSRRKFMKAGILAAACAGLPLKSALGQKMMESSKAFPLLNAGLRPTPSSVSSSLEQLGYYNKSAFTPYVNTAFSVHLSSSSTRSLTLTEVGDYLKPISQVDASANALGSECFSLLFQIPQGKSFNQDTYMIEHEALGTFYMFLVPVSPRGQKQSDSYEAVIYRRQQDNEMQQAAAANDPAQIRGTASGPWRVKDANGEHDVFAFETLLPDPRDVGKKEEPPAPVQATWMTMAQDRGINGIKLGMTAQQVLALFPGSKDDEEVRANLAQPSELGISNLIIRPQQYSSKADFEGISQIILTLLDGRVSTLYVGYDAPQAENLDDAVTKFSKGRKLPPAGSWKAYQGLDDQLKTMKCKDFEISVFAGGKNVNVNYVKLVDMVAQQKLKERKAKMKKSK